MMRNYFNPDCLLNGTRSCTKDKRQIVHLDLWNPMPREKGLGLIQGYIVWI
jgi:hypothetical protein